MKLFKTSWVLFVVLNLPWLCSAAGAKVTAFERGDVVIIKNKLVRLEYNLLKGTYSAFDSRDSSACISGAYYEADGIASTGKGIRSEWKSRNVLDALGNGKVVVVKKSFEGKESLLLEFVLYEGKGFIVIRGGIENSTSEPVQLKIIKPLGGANIFKGLDISKNFSMIDGNGGAAETSVLHGGSLKSRNNLLVTFRHKDKSRSLVIGGLTYHDFEKFANAGEYLARRAKLEKLSEERGKLLCYLDVPGDLKEKSRTGQVLEVVQGKPFSWSEESWDAEFGSILFHEEAVIVKVSGLERGKKYSVGLSWWDYDNNSRVQSIYVTDKKGERKKIILEKRQLPAWRAKRKPPEEITFTLPSEFCQAGEARINIANEAKVPNAVLSEIWIRECTKEFPVFIKSATGQGKRPPQALSVQLYAEDPVGKRVDPGKRYLPDDYFYIDFMTDNPFEALEKYGKSVRTAQKINLNVYDFPTVCLWYAEVYGHGQASNDTPGAVEEMKKIVKSGFLKYSRVAVRLVPDLYTANNQQGWWDDEHWKRGRSKPDRGNGQYAKPYETSAKWAGAVTKLGGIPLTYFQTSFRSEDYAKKFPGHMLFNKSMAPRFDASGKPRKFLPTMNAWQRNSVLQGYDFTDPEFQKHMRGVFANLRQAGVKGLMYDYPASGWADQGGMEDKYSTTAAAYRKILFFSYNGLGPDCWIHERALARGSDVSLGLVASQRVWGDTDLVSPRMLTRCGLRWYKNRVVVSYDMDAKSLLKVRPKNRDGVRQLLTMCYVVSGRLLLGNSFGNMSRENVFDLSRIFPYHRAPESARPVDAFTSRYPRIYDFEVDPRWHQLTFYNSELKKNVIGVELAGDTALGSLGLDSRKNYYVYDFWNDLFVGKLKGSERLEQELRPGEARMLSIHEAAGYPQFISTNRHVMQGYVDILAVKWDTRTRQLKGSSKVAGDDPYKVVIALNGYKPVSCRAEGAESSVRIVSGEKGIAQLVIKSPESRVVKWSVKFSGMQR